MKSSRSGQLEEINITPLTDVFLVLLIIMMLVAPLIDLKGLDMAAPDAASSSQANGESKQLLVEVMKNGEYHVDGKVVDKVSLSSTVKEQAPSKPEGVLIAADPDATHQAFTFALSAVNTAGVKDISIEDTAAAGDSGGDTGAASAPEEKKPAAKKAKAKK